MLQLGIEDDDEEESLYKKLGRAWWLQEDLDLVLAEIVSESSTFVWNLGLSIVDAMGLSLANCIDNCCSV